MQCSELGHLIRTYCSRYPHLPRLTSKRRLPLLVLSISRLMKDFPTTNAKTISNPTTLAHNLVLPSRLVTCPTTVSSKLSMSPQNRSPSRNFNYQLEIDLKIDRGQIHLRGRVRDSLRSQFLTSISPRLALRSQFPTSWVNCSPSNFQPTPVAKKNAPNGNCKSSSSNRKPWRE